MTHPVDLSGMLADSSASGAYYVAADGREALEEAAARLEFAFARIDLAGCTDREQVLARIARALDFPDWFGGNWDALADCLADLSWWPAPGYVWVLDHPHDWQQADPVGFDVLLDIGNDVAATWSEHGVPFWLLFPAPAEQLAP
jgi:hypothetical protein